MAIDDNITIAARLKSSREAISEHGPKEFYEGAGITGNPYYNWESDSGKYRISVENAGKLRDRYGLTLDWIFLGMLDTLPQKVATALSSKP